MSLLPAVLAALVAAAFFVGGGYAIWYAVNPSGNQAASVFLVPGIIAVALGFRFAVFASTLRRRALREDR